MHGVLILGFLLFSTWAWNIICPADVFSWNFTFMLVNMAQVMYILYQMRPVRFPPELDEIYACLFQPMQVSRQLFKKLVSMERAQIFTLHAGEAYAMQNLTRADRLSLLISGRVNVLSDNRLLHHIYSRQFLDSPEFEATKPGGEEKFKVTIMAAVPSRYVSWQREVLEYLFAKETYLAHIMGILIARDITTKLYAMNEKIVTDRGYPMDIRLPSITSSLLSYGGTATTTTHGDRSNSSAPSVHTRCCDAHAAAGSHHSCSAIATTVLGAQQSPAMVHRPREHNDGNDSVFGSKERLVMEVDEEAVVVPVAVVGVAGNLKCHPLCTDDVSDTKHTNSSSSTEEQYTAIAETWPVTA